MPTRTGLSAVLTRHRPAGATRSALEMHVRVLSRSVRDDLTVLPDRTECKGCRSPVRRAGPRRRGNAILIVIGVAAAGDIRGVDLPALRVSVPALRLRVRRPPTRRSPGRPAGGPRALRRQVVRDRQLPAAFPEGVHRLARRLPPPRRRHGRSAQQLPPRRQGGHGEGQAWVVDKATGAKLKVSFFWPFRGDYWVVELGDDYEYAVVSAPSMKYLWILSRTPQMDEQRYREIVGRLQERGSTSRSSAGRRRGTGRTSSTDHARTQPRGSPRRGLASPSCSRSRSAYIEFEVRLGHLAHGAAWKPALGRRALQRHKLAAASDLPRRDS